MLDFERMNASQREAAKWGEGPMLVLAGPGSGKTYVLTRRVARLVLDTPDSRFKVLGLTFTTKAADEMRSRVSELLGPDAYRARLTTFHSFAAEVLRQHGSHFGLRPDFEILARDADRVQVMSEAITAAQGHDIADSPNGKSIAPVIDRLLREGHDGGDAALPFRNSAPPWVRTVYKSYMNLLVESNYLDFGTLLVYCLRLFRERPRLARHYRVVYPFACVDEYQDTNKVQDLLLRSLYPERDANLFVVADDDQIIYQWNGASPARLRKLRKDYGMTVVQLPESYRCPPAVVHLANCLIRHNIDRDSDKKPLVSAVAPQESGGVRVRRFDDEDAELEWVADDILDRSLPPAECTVLARNGKLIKRAAEALRCAGLSPYLPERKNEFRSPLLRCIHFALRLANNPNDTDKLAQLCKGYGDLTGQDISAEGILEESWLTGDTLLREFTNFASEFGPDSAEPILGALRDHLLERLKYREFVNDIFVWRGDVHVDEEKEERSTWRELERSVRHDLGGDPTLNQFLHGIDLRSKTPSPGRADIQCLTIHMAKGKEFEHVYLVGLAEDQLPSYYAVQQGQRAIEEERRSCFVAITRVCSSLTMTLADSYLGWTKQPSRFLAEMGIDIDRI